MKKNLFMVAAVALIAIVSCNKDFTETANPEQNGETISFTAFVDGAELPEPEVKAVLGTSANNKPQSKWEAGDAITIHNGTKGFVFKTNDANTAAARFTYSGNDFSAANEVIAAYPSGTYTVDMASRTITGTIPTSQECKLNTYHPSAGLAVAYSSTENLAFKNACALLKFTVNSDNVKSVTISGNNGEKISGEVKVTLAEDGTVSSVEPTAKSQSYVEIWTYKDKLMKKGDVYYVAIIPQHFEYGLKAEVQLTDEYQDKNRAKEIITAYTINRNEVVDLGTMTHTTNALGSGYVMPGGYNAWAVNGSEAKYFYEIGDFYVVRNVKFMNTKTGSEAGFKVLKNDVWKGVSSSSDVALDTWHGLNGNSNINVASNVAYDVYLTKDGNRVYITAAGGKVPDKPAVVAAKDGYLYLKPNSNWTQGNARFAAYFFGNDDTWVSMTDPDGDGIYEVQKPTNKNYPNVIFCRMNPSSTTNGWTKETQFWNQTSDLTVPTNGNNLYTVKDGTWDKGGGTWSKVTEF